MFRIKRLYTFMLQTFLPLFIMTFGICLFIVLMQFLWKYIDDMVGKGFDIAVLGEMFLYAALTLVPMALPLAILLASLMTFGNLGEQLELLAMKSAGVSLLRIMRPLIITLIFVSAGAFFFQNNVLPVAQVKLYTLLFSMRQKSPEVEIPAQVFYSELPQISLYVREKEKDGRLNDIMIYDYSKGFNNAMVTVADSGRLKMSEDKKFFIMTLFSGESFSNVHEQPSTNRVKEAVAYQRETFGSKDILIEYDVNFERKDESFMSNQYIGKDMKALQESIDSMTYKLDSINAINSQAIYNNSYKKSLTTGGNSNRSRGQAVEIIDVKKEETHPEELPAATTIILNYDSIYTEQKPNDQAAILARAKSSIDNMRNEYIFKASMVSEEASVIRRHKTELHKKFTLSLACIVFFFIGAPLGAIIRKGGLGTPVVISVILFIFYHIIDNVSFKMARSGVWPVWQGMWMSSFILTPLGIFLTYKAINDSVILNADTYLNAIKRFFGRRAGRKVELKEVIMHTPDYQKLLTSLEKLSEESRIYLASHKRWTNYLTFWKQGGKDTDAEMIAGQMEEIVEELSNSDQNLILNKLMDYPVIGGYNLSKIKFTGNIGIITGLFLPIGLPVYLIATYQRKLVRQDVETVRKVSNELYDLLYNLK